MEINDLLFGCLPPLAQIARAGYLFSVGLSLQPTALLPANFVLFNGGTGGYPIVVISARISSAANMTATLNALLVDPALGNPVTAVNLRGFLTSGSAINESAVIAAPTTAGLIAESEFNLSAPWDACSPAPIFLDNGRGIVLTTAALASTCMVNFVWAEIPR